MYCPAFFASFGAGFALTRTYLPVKLLSHKQQKEQNLLYNNRKLSYRKDQISNQAREYAKKI
jgi:hypothetical protein